MSEAWIPILPHLLLSSGALLVFLLGAFWSSRPVGTLLGISLAFCAAAGLGALLPPAGQTAHLLDVSISGRYFAGLICLLTFIVLLFTGPYARRRGFETDELYALILLSAMGMMLVAGALNWAVLFVGLELFSISLYVLLALRKGRPGPLEASVKYFVLGSAASSFLLFGIALVYAGSGSLDIAAGLASADALNASLLGIVFILVGLGFKISLAPFHLWTPDVYEGAPAPIAAFLSTGSKVAVYAALLRLALSSAQGAWEALSPAIWALAALTMIAGNLGALTQQRLKRMLAYSSVAHMGYMLMALNAVGASGPGPIMFYAAAFALMDLGAFGSLGLLSPEEDDLDAIEGFQGLGFARYWPAGMLALSLLTLAGLPPTAGFFGKFLLFKAAIQAGYPGLAVIGIATAILSVYYYLRPLTFMYMRPAQAEAVPSPVPWSGHLGLGMVLLGILLLGLAPAPVIEALAGLAP
jgi:NADH-quinone oxidoreductase subunit N